MAGAAFFFSLMSLFVKLAGDTLSAMEIVAVRGVITWIATLWMLRAARVPALGTHDFGLLVLRGVLGVVALICYYIAVIRLPLAEATVFHFTSPLFTAVLAAAFLAETMGRKEVALAATGFLGVLVIARPDFGLGLAPSALDPVAVAIGLTGALFSAGAYTVVRRLGRSQHHLVVIHYYALATVLVGVPIAARSARWPTRDEWLLLVGVGLATQIGQIFLTKALQFGRAGPVMSVGYLQIAFAAVWGVMFFGTMPDAWGWLGAAIIVGSTLVLGRVRAQT